MHQDSDFYAEIFHSPQVFKLNYPQMEREFKLGISTIVKMYVEKLISRYPYWNKTQGAGYFFVTCHDIGVRVTKGVHPLMENSIRVVCLSQHGSGYMPHKDVSSLKPVEMA
ncbi:hypothetical protein Pint_33439 [Pistacia integerrima]|uniref:Uncharacterized protein n=1 Tax=Pistacia integerrima TaxID=434235 RepID=A0ACC0X530_9ROSI|nr:hypothetical protein Pint_33439 [Pistacia integerrima]